jgi:hypothetical protein
MSAAEMKAIADEIEFSDFQEIPDSPKKPDATQDILNNFEFIGIQAPKGARQLAAEAAAARSLYGSQSSEPVSVNVKAMRVT